MSIFVPEYIAFSVISLVFAYHVLKELFAADKGNEERTHQQRTRQQTGR